MGWFLLVAGVVVFIVLCSVAIYYLGNRGPARRTGGAAGGYLGWTYADDWDRDDDDRGSGDEDGGGWFGGWGDGGGGDSGGDGGGGDGGGDGGGGD